MTQETHAFQAEVSRLLNIVVHSLYSDKDIFLRELISNASDACDKLRYLALTEPALSADDTHLKVTLSTDKTTRTLTVADNGIGMNREELIENLGTIARSGTAAFLDHLNGENAKDVKLIGQFGVGFYSAFMVAEKVEVFSRKAGEANGWRWTSTGTGSFEIDDAPEATRGTRIVLHLRDGEDQFLERATLERIVKRYSDHVALPIVFHEGDKDETLNHASALWTRSKSDVTAEQYREFYHAIGHNFDEPWLTIHQKAEGKIEYTALLFVPTEKPFDLFNPDRKHRVKLYVRRVFITDDCEGLVPAYFRFLRGVIDSEDLPLNVSRETLQDNPMLARIRQAVVKRVFAELETKAKDAGEEYLRFWDAFGAALKEGLYEDFENRDRLLKLARFRSTKGDGWVSLDDYLKRMKEGQDAIYIISGEHLDNLSKSPQLEGFRAKDIEVLLLTDPVDDFWTGLGLSYEGKAFRSVTKGGADLDRFATDAKAEKKSDAAPESQIATLVALLKQTLGDAVKDVRTSQRLTESAVCLVAADGDMDIHLSRVLARAKQIATESPRILEINPRHSLIGKLAGLAAAGGHIAEIETAAQLLLDQARIIEGEALPDPATFAKRMAETMAKAFGG